MTRQALTVCAKSGCPELVRSGYCPSHQPPARPGRRMPTDWKATRKRIIQRDHGVCNWCGAKATSCDHLIPVALGGSDDDVNIVASCWPCNRSRGNRLGPPPRLTR